MEHTSSTLRCHPFFIESAKYTVLLLNSLIKYQKPKHKPSKQNICLFLLQRLSPMTQDW